MNKREFLEELPKLRKMKPRLEGCDHALIRFGTVGRVGCHCPITALAAARGVPEIPNAGFFRQAAEALGISKTLRDEITLAADYRMTTDLRKAMLKALKLKQP